MAGRKEHGHRRQGSPEKGGRGRNIQPSYLSLISFHISRRPVSLGGSLADWVCRPPKQSMAGNGAGGMERNQPRVVSETLQNQSVRQSLEFFCLLTAAMSIPYSNDSIPTRVEEGGKGLPASLCFILLGMLSREPQQTSPHMLGHRWVTCLSLCQLQVRTMMVLMAVDHHNPTFSGFYSPKGIIESVILGLHPTSSTSKS